MEVDITPAKSSDLLELFNLVNAAYRIELGEDGVAFKNLDRLVTPTELDLGITFTARKKAQGELVGCVCATVKDCVAFVGPLAVDPKYQGHGLGKTLMHFCESLAPVVQVDVVSCRTDLFPFYDRLGYKRVRSYPAEEYIEPERLTRKGLKIVVLRKTTRELRSGEKIPAVEKNWKPLE